MGSLLTILNDQPEWATAQIQRFKAHNNPDNPANYHFDESTNLEGLLQRIPVDMITQHIQALDEDEAIAE